MGKRQWSTSGLLAPCEEDWIDIFNQLKEMSISTFSWGGLPPEINQQFLEEKLFENGRVALLYEDALDKYFALPFTNVNELDPYGKPSQVILHGVNGENYNGTVGKDCVLIYDNMIRISKQRRLEKFAKRIFNIELTIDINIAGQKTPFILELEKETHKLTLNSIYQAVDNFEIGVMVNKNMTSEKAINYYQTTSPFVSDKLDEIRRKLWNEALSLIGIENNFSEKNERLTANEVLVSNGLAISMKQSRKLAREQASEQINRLFELNTEISVNNLGVMESELEVVNQGGGELG